MAAAHPSGDPLSGTMLSQPRRSPTMLRLMLGNRLRQLREAQRITRGDAGSAIRASDSKISRLELGRVSFKERDVADLLSLYGVLDDTAREGFLGLARQANRPGWWHDYADVLEPWFEMYVGLEDAASRIREYEVQFVPGLLQTRDYIRAVTVLGNVGAREHEIEQRVELRLARQRLLTAPEAPLLWVVVDEAALRRPMGGREVMRAQLRHLIEMASLPNVTIQILSFQDGGNAAAGAFSVLRFAEPDVPDVVYVEQLASAVYLDKRAEVDLYLSVMERLCLEARPPEETTGILERLIDTM